MIPLRRPLRKFVPYYALLLTGAFFLTNLFGCGGDDITADTIADMAVPAPDLLTPAPRYNIHGTVAFTADAQGVGVFAQNGVFAHIPKADVVGKKILWVILKGGEQIANGKMLEVGGGTIDDNLRCEFTTEHGYPDGPWEVALLVLLTTTDVAMAPQPGDLAAFDVTKPPAGEPPVTGTSVRVSLHGADTAVTLVNRNFIKL